MRTGSEAIVSALRELPMTRHPMDDPQKMIVDSFQMGVMPNIMLLIVVHGEFAEGKKN